jgi:hypothetical protein
MFGITSPKDLLIYGCGAVIVLLMLAAGWQTMRLGWVQVELAQEQKDRADERAVREETARRAEQRNAELVRGNAVAMQEAVNAYRLELRGETSRADDADQRAAELREQIAAATAARDHGPATTTPVARGDRDLCATGWNLLEGTDRLAGKYAALLERRSAQIRLLKRQIDADRLACQPEASPQ